MTSDSPARKTFGWAARLKYGLLAAAVAWFAGWIISFPFELSLAWRYVDGNARLLPEALVKGLVVWGGFSLFMAAAGFTPLVLPAVLFVPPRWVVRWRALLIPAAALAAILSVDRRMGLLQHLLFPSSARYPGVLLQRAQFLCDYLRPGGGVGVCRAGAAAAGGGLIVVVTVSNAVLVSASTIGRLSSDDTPDQFPCRSFLFLFAIRHAPAGGVA